VLVRQCKRRAGEAVVKYILVSCEGQDLYDSWQAANAAYDALKDKRRAYIKRVKR